MECGAYTKFQQVVSATKRHGLNTTEYIATCEDACVVIFGAGNQVRTLSYYLPRRELLIHVPNATVGYIWHWSHDRVLHPSSCGRYIWAIPPVIAFYTVPSVAESGNPKCKQRDLEQP